MVPVKGSQRRERANRKRQKEEGTKTVKNVRRGKGRNDHIPFLRVLLSLARHHL